MLEFTTVIGSSEKHNISFQFNQKWKSLKITADGRTIAKKGMNLRFFRSREFVFEVGDEEKHEVKIELVKSVFPIGYKECTAWVFVDGEKTEEHSGRISGADWFFNGVGIFFSTAIILLIASLITLFIAALVYVRPIRIDNRIDGVLIRTGDSIPDFIEHKEIVIDGWYFRKIFKADVFLGVLYLEGLVPRPEDTSPFENYEIHFVKSRLVRWPGSLFYIEEFKYGEFDFVNVGSVYLDVHGDSIMVTFSEQTESGGYHWSGDDGLMYCAPADTRDEALELGTDFFRSIWGDKIPDLR